ncbi:hypothetical protein DMH27_09145 [Raoultella planticola]|uniref:Uncharacterized protein n=1 Tax=Raoultella planticola TaxID=575 RepID=A0A5P6AA39_RAOPL|nr:hypothetical protein [Raoultella planticola]QFG76504.1 hypothetical protein DMB90_04915 [Raoultella planticola]
MTDAAGSVFSPSVAAWASAVGWVTRNPMATGGVVVFVTVPDTAPASHSIATLKLLVLVMLALSSAAPIGEE